MPGFGKSGTCRMRCFKASMRLPCLARTPRLPNLEPSGGSRRRVIVRDDVLQARAAGAAMQFSLETVDRLALAFDERLHAAVGPIHHPAAETFQPRRFLHEVPVADALHTPTHDESPGREHPASI